MGERHLEILEVVREQSRVCPAIERGQGVSIERFHEFREDLYFVDFAPVGSPVGLVLQLRRIVGDPRDPPRWVRAG